MIINLDNLFIFSAHRIASLRNFLSFVSEAIDTLIKSTELTHSFPNTAVHSEFRRLIMGYIEANADEIGEMNLPEVKKIYEILSRKINSIKYRELLEHDIPEIISVIEHLGNLVSSPNLASKDEFFKINAAVKSTRISNLLSTVPGISYSHATICRIIDLLSSPDGLIDINLLEMFIDKFSLEDGQLVLPIYMPPVDSGEEVEASEVDEAESVIEPGRPSILSPAEHIIEPQISLASNRVFSKIALIVDSLSPTEGSAAPANIRIFYALYSGVKTLATLPPILNAEDCSTFQAELDKFITEFESMLLTSEGDITFKESITKIINRIKSISSHPNLKLEEPFSVSKANAQLNIFYKLLLKLSDVNTLTPQQRTFSFIKEECHGKASKLVTSTAEFESLISALNFIISKLSTINGAEDHDSFIRIRDAAIQEIKDFIQICPNLGDSEDKILMFLNYIEDFEIWGLVLNADGESIDDMIAIHKAAYSCAIEELSSVITSLQSAAESYHLNIKFLQKYYRACVVGCDQSAAAKEIYALMLERLSTGGTTDVTSVDKSIVLFQSSASIVEERILRKRIEEAALRNPAPSIYTNPRFALIHDALEELDPDTCDVIMDFWNNTIYSTPIYSHIAELFDKILNSEQLEEFIDNFLKGAENKHDNILTQLMSFDSVSGISEMLDIIGKAMEHEEQRVDVIHQLLDYCSPDALEILLHFLPDITAYINYRSPDYHNLTPLLRVASSRRFSTDEASTIADILACNGASLSDTDAEGNNPLLLAAKRKAPMIFHTLREYATPEVLSQTNSRKESVSSLREGVSMSTTLPLYSSRTATNMFAMLDDDTDDLRASPQTLRPIRV